MNPRGGERALVVGAEGSRLAVRTHASGLLARLAHDLEIVAGALTGDALVDGGAWSAQLTIGVSGLRVAGVLKGDRVDPAVLSASDRAEIERRMQSEVFAGVREIAVTARGATQARGDVTVRLGARAASTTTTLIVAEREGQLVATGRAELRLSALGIREIKGPLGAFRVNDVVLVVYEIVLRAR